MASSQTAPPLPPGLLVDPGWGALLDHPLLDLPVAILSEAHGSPYGSPVDRFSRNKSNFVDRMVSLFGFEPPENSINYEAPLLGTLASALPPNHVIRISSLASFSLILLNPQIVLVAPFYIWNTSGYVYAGFGANAFLDGRYEARRLREEIVVIGDQAAYFNSSRQDDFAVSRMDLPDLCAYLLREGYVQPARLRQALVAFLREPPDSEGSLSQQQLTYVLNLLDDSGNSPDRPINGLPAWLADAQVGVVLFTRKASDFYYSEAWKQLEKPNEPLRLEATALVDLQQYYRKRLNQNVVPNYALTIGQYATSYAAVKIGGKLKIVYKVMQQSYKVMQRIGLTGWLERNVWVPCYTVMRRIGLTGWLERNVQIPYRTWRDARIAQARSEQWLRYRKIRHFVYRHGARTFNPVYQGGKAVSWGYRHTVVRAAQDLGNYLNSKNMSAWTKPLTWDNAATTTVQAVKELLIASRQDLATGMAWTRAALSEGKTQTVEMARYVSKPLAEAGRQVRTATVQVARQVVREVPQLVRQAVRATPQAARQAVTLAPQVVRQGGVEVAKMVRYVSKPLVEGVRQAVPVVRQSLPQIAATGAVTVSMAKAGISALAPAGMVAGAVVIGSAAGVAAGTAINAGLTYAISRAYGDGDTHTLGDAVYDGYKKIVG